MGYKAINIKKDLHEKALEIHNRDFPAGPDMSRGARKHYPMDTFNLIMQLGLTAYERGDLVNDPPQQSTMTILEAMEILACTPIDNLATLRKESTHG